MNIRITVAVLLCMAMLVSGCAQPKTDGTVQKIQEHLTQGDTFFFQKQFDQAIVEFTRAIELNPRLAIGYFNRGYAYSKQSDWNSALSDVNKAIAIDPGLAAAYWIQGRIYHLNGGKYEQALASYSKAIELDPKFSTVFFDRGWAYTGNGAYDRGIDDFNKGFALQKDVVSAYNGRGWCAANKAQWSQSSYLYLLQHFESDAGRWIVYQGPGWSLLKNPLWEYAASPDMATVLIQDPDPLTIFMNRGFAHVRKAHWDMAIASYKAVMAANPGLERDNYNLPWAEGKRNEWDAAIADYSKILELNPLFKSSAVSSGANEWEMALADYKKVIEFAKDTTLVQKAKDTLAVIDTWRNLK